MTGSCIEAAISKARRVHASALLDVYMCTQIAGEQIKHGVMHCGQQVAASKLGVEPSECLVVEDSQKGLQDAMAAGMRCVITYTNNTKWQVRRRCWCWCCCSCFRDSIKPFLK